MNPAPPVTRIIFICPNPAPDHGHRALCRPALTLYVLCPSLAHALPSHRTMVVHSIPIRTAVTSPPKAFLSPCVGPPRNPRLQAYQRQPTAPSDSRARPQALGTSAHTRASYQSPNRGLVPSCQGCRNGSTVLPRQSPSSRPGGRPGATGKSAHDSPSIGKGQTGISATRHGAPHRSQRQRLEAHPLLAL